MHGVLLQLSEDCIKEVFFQKQIITYASSRWKNVAPKHLVLYLRKGLEYSHIYYLLCILTSQLLFKMPRQGVRYQTECYLG
jgi:hypothetical protein